jgi:hypothetical protein
MKKIVILLSVLLLLTFAVWAEPTAVRTAHNNAVQIQLNGLTSNSGEVIEILSGGVTLTGNIPEGCAFNVYNNVPNTKLKCTIGSGTSKTIAYTTSGSGTINGTYSYFVPPATVTTIPITGNSLIPSSGNPACTDTDPTNNVSVKGVVTNSVGGLGGSLLPPQYDTCNGPSIVQIDCGTSGVITTSAPQSCPSGSTCVEGVCSLSCTPVPATNCTTGVSCNDGVATAIPVLGCSPGKSCNAQNVCVDNITPPVNNDAALMTAIQNSLNTLHQAESSPSLLQKLTAIAQGIKNYFATNSE